MLTARLIVPISATAVYHAEEADDAGAGDVAADTQVRCGECSWRVGGGCMHVCSPLANPSRVVRL
jgi:hypothetical protein